MSKTIILGAGFTGLAAGIKTGATVYEKSNDAGGICRAYWKNGFQFSVGGGHWIFGKGIGLEYIKSLVQLKEIDRKAGIYFNHTFPYPFQTIAQKEEELKKGSLKSWLRGNFSREECNIFFNPFNEKYTAGLYDEVIQHDEYKTPPAGGVGFVPKFYDPVRGLDHLVNVMADKCNIEYGKEAVLIDPEDKQVFFTDNTYVKYDKLITTLPLAQTMKMCGQEYDLPYTSVFVLNIGAYPDANTPQEHWLYIPYSKTGFYRVGFYSNVDNKKAPSGMISLSVEMAFRSEVDDKTFDFESLSNRIIDELQSWRFIGDVVTIDPTFVKCAYTWLRDKDEPARHIDWLKDRGITSTGRYGKWKFQGFTQSIEDGLSL